MKITTETIWKCNRCGAIKKNGRCKCTESPSPWRRIGETNLISFSVFDLIGVTLIFLGVALYFHHTTFNLLRFVYHAITHTL